MGIQSIVTGYITIKSEKDIDHTKKVLNNFDYDKDFPFTNIFQYISTEQYNFPLIIFGGSYKQIEDVWNEWLWKFSKLLKSINAINSQVHLNCLLGQFYWKLKPESLINNKIKGKYINEEWYIVEAPKNDFCISEDWMSTVKKNMPTYNWHNFIKRKIEVSYEILKNTIQSGNIDTSQVQPPTHP